MTSTKSHTTLKEREHDYLYDPVYTLSSAKDHERTMHKSLTNLSHLQKLFSFQNMFSEIGCYHPFEWRINRRDPVPPSVPRNFRPVDLCGKMLRQRLGLEGCEELEAMAVSRDRAKFFSYKSYGPKLFMPGDAVHVDMAIEAMAMGRDLFSSAKTPRGPLTQNKFVQTIYRDSEAQTDPYSPPYVVNVGETPEVLTLATLGYGKGLPAGLHDVEMIERARDRREMERNLEPFEAISHDPKKILKRRKILQDMELREWYFREREVEALQEVRLKVLIQLLRKREVHRQEIAARRLDRVWEEKCVEKEARCRAVQHRYITALRKLLRKRIAEEEDLCKRDVIKDYSTPSSQAFAPLTRLGVFPDRGSENFVVKNAYLSTYEGLLELESGLPRSVFEPRIAIKPIQMYTKDGFLKREYRHQKELAKLQTFLEGAFVTTKKPPRKPRFLEKIEKPAPRPITPSIAPSLQDDAWERDKAAIKLQRLIRGRAVQTQMYEGKEKRKELIEELRSTHALLEDDQAEKRRQKLSILGAQHKHENVVHEDSQVDDVLSRMESGSLAEMLDFLSKELDRLIEERRVHALVLLAERHRRMREAEESGTRQREERRRREQDEIFKQIVKVHQESVDGYLAVVAGVAVDSTAERIAEQEMEMISKSVDGLANELEQNRDELQSDIIAADLIHNFLIPEVNKRAYQAFLNARQRKFLQAAHREIWTPTHEAAEVEQMSQEQRTLKVEISTMTPKMELLTMAHDTVSPPDQGLSESGTQEESESQPETEQNLTDY
ncbi:unnamed protein product [Calicophoron daubneyi]|uniref:Cilia- and flagella-associated protein 91 n=1 Tax=Calicophoron daubneyi TaxID=300641 RepID=A0AAV2T5W2_CALDB